MDLAKVIQDNNLSKAPIGLGGCRASGIHFDSCGFDLIVFDGKSDSKVIKHDGHYITIYHATLNETNSKKLLQYHNLKIIQDDSWELHMLLSKINEKRLHLFSDFAKNCLIESLFCCQKTIDAVDASDVFAPCWQKCASYFLADAILSLNHIWVGPSHMMDALRRLEKKPIDNHIAVATQSIGIERATPTLLERMTKSTIGFSEITHDKNLSSLIKSKHDFFIKNSMLADWYYYLGYVNCNNFTNIWDRLNHEQDLFHILKVAFDVESDSNILVQQSNLVKDSSTSILEIISSTRH